MLRRNLAIVFFLLVPIVIHAADLDHPVSGDEEIENTIENSKLAGNSPFLVDGEPAENVENSKRITSNCNHDVCETCFTTYLTSIQKFNFKNPSCCLCRTNVTSLTFTDNECCNTIKTTFLN
jgi:hypothetical protein